MPVEAHSQLMTNHVPGVALAAQRRLRTVYSDSHSPLLFALDERNKFSLTLPSATSTTGWERLDLTASLAAVPELGTSPVVHSFAVAQEQGGGVRVVLAAAAKAGAESRVYVSGRMANTESTKDWSALASTLVHRPVPAGLTVTDILTGNIDDGTPFSVVVTLDGRGQVEYHQINPDPAGSWSSTPVPLPQNATKCLSVAVGKHADLGPGIYSLFELGRLHSLVFSTLPVEFDGEMMFDTVELDLPDGFSPRTVTTVATSDGLTELYVGGEGVCRYSIDAQSSSHRPSETLLDAKQVSGVRDLIVATDQKTQQISLWAIDARDALMYVEASRPADGGEYAWQPALLLDTEVSALSAYRVRTDPGHERSSVAMAIGGADGGFRMAFQDPQTALWQHQTVSLHTTTEVLALQTYTTRVVLTDEAGKPLRNKEVAIQPDRDCAALVNGRYYALRAEAAKPATTDSRGVVTIVLETTNLTAPVYTFHVEGSASVTADPGADTKQNLRALTGKAIGKAVRSDGKPLFDTKPDAKKCDAAADAVRRLMTAHDKLASQPPGARSAVPQARSDSLIVQIGDLLAVLSGNPAAVLSYSIDPDVSAGVWHLIVEVGEVIYQAMIDAAHKAVAAIDWVLKHTLGITLQDIVAWLGFVFNWDDILANHRVLGKIVTLSFDHMVAELAKTKTTVDDWFGTVRTKFTGDKLVVDTSADIFAKRVGRDTAPPSADHQKALDKPQTSWGEHQLGSNLGQATPGAYVPEDLGDVLSSVADEELAILRQVGGQLSDLFGEKLADMTLAEMVTAVVDIVGLAMVDTLENITLTAIDAGILLLKVIKSILTSRWDIPVLTPLYEKVICGGDGSKLTLLDLMCLLGAIPATLVGKVVLPGKRNLFTTAQISAVRKAATWDQLMKALSSTPPRTAMAAANASDDVIVAGVLQLVNSFLRVLNNVMGVPLDLEMSPVKTPWEDLFRRAKIAVEWTMYTFGLASMAMLFKDKRNDRENLDIAITVLGFVPPTISTARQYFRETGKAGGDAARYVETAYGLVLLVLASVSVVMQSTEQTPPGLTPIRQGALLTLKAMQNFCAAVNSGFSMYLANPWREDPPTLALGILVRGIASAIRQDVQIFRSLAQLVDSVVDFEGAIP